MKNKNQNQIDLILGAIRRKVELICSDYVFEQKLYFKKYMRTQMNSLNNMFNRLEILYNNPSDIIHFYSDGIYKPISYDLQK